MSHVRTFYLISLGCPKNLVDSAGMATLLRRAGYAPASIPEEADLLIVNTCGFIASAREESLEVLQELTRARRPDQHIVAAGCYSQRFPHELAGAVPGVDGLIGTRRWMDVVSLLERLGHEEGGERRPVYHVPGTPTVGVLIAQDTTDYGRDLGIEEGLAELLERLVATVPEVDWIRLMYAYPGRVTERLIEVMARHPRILPYLDIPLQHAHPDVLRRMRRPADVERVRRTLERLRTAMPEIAIRTTFLVGYPGETEAEFHALVDFVAEMAFERVGTFAYSHEEGTPAAELEDDVPPELKEQRRQRLMEVQQPISLAKNQALVGRTMDVLVEGQGEGLSIGRSYRDAPEVDGLVLVQAELPVGEIVPVRVTAALEYDLVGEPDSMAWEQQAA